MSRDRKTCRAYRVATLATGTFAFVLGWIFNIFGTLAGGLILYFFAFVILGAFDVSLGFWTLFIPCALVVAAVVWVINQTTDALIHSAAGDDKDDSQGR